jgi:hypothetical protein
MTNRACARFVVPMLLAWLFAPTLTAQVPGPPQPARTARAAAPIDLTGQWVSVISEDWRWRMVTPLKGDFANIPVNAEARKVGLAWDPAKDEAAGEACKAYGAPAIMRVPGRLRISWMDDETLKIEADAGMQTRVLSFRPTSLQTGERQWQGESVARWEAPARGAVAPAFFALGLGPRAGALARSLEVVTTRIRPGYLRRNGIPYSADVSMTEYFDTFKEPAGTEWFVVTTIVRDPQYLIGPWVTTTNFKRETGAAPWSPSPCSAR